MKTKTVHPDGTVSEEVAELDIAKAKDIHGVLAKAKAKARGVDPFAKADAAAWKKARAARKKLAKAKSK